MPYVDKRTGKAISTEQHVYNCVETLLTTRIGERLRRRLYGCNSVFRLDAPLNNTTLVQVYGDVATAIFLYEPRLLPLRVQVEEGEYAKGRVVLGVRGLLVPEDREVEFTGLVLLES